MATPTADLFDGYAVGAAWDEVFAAPGVPHPQSRALHEARGAMSAEDLDGRSTALARAFRDQGIAFSLSGEATRRGSCRSPVWSRRRSRRAR